MLCSVRDVDAKHRRASIHWARSRATFLKVLTACFNDEIIIKKRIYTHHTPTQQKKQTKKKHTYDLCEERMKQRNSADGSLLICPGETALLCVAKESREALRAPEVPAPQRAALQATKGISAGGYITHPYVSRAGVRSSSSSSSRALNHRWCSERSKEFEALVPRGTPALFSSTKKKIKKMLRYHESSALSAGGFPLHLGDICQVASKLLSVLSSAVVFTDSSTLGTTSRWEPAGTGRKRPLCWG